MLRFEAGLLRGLLMRGDSRGCGVEADNARMAVGLTGAGGRRFPARAAFRNPRAR
ncbi:hypothetical protein GCM10022229_07410 [Luteimonas lutimaris]|uniref:Uncharacterized protein n=1 Tax=Luteimonas lutimaris TaxID=698645 RepID=A0ABP7MAQ6_9GAMM